MKTALGKTLDETEGLDWCGMFPIVDGGVIRAIVDGTGDIVAGDYYDLDDCTYSEEVYFYSDRLAKWREENPATLWDQFLGDQSPAEFMELSEGMTPEEALGDFLDHGIGGGDPLFQPLTKEEKEVLRKKLVAHIEEGKYYDS